MNNFNKLLVCGPGSIGLKHIEAARAINPNLSLAVLRSRNISDNSIINYNWKEFKSYKECLNWKPDLVIISTPAKYHITFTEVFSKSGIPILLEKPIGVVTDSIESWEEIAYSSISKINVGYLLRFNPCYERFKKLLLSGILGEIIHTNIYCGSWLPDWRQKNFRESVSVSKSLGGGAMAELSHELDLALSLFDNLVVCWADLYNAYFKNMEVEDSLALEATSDLSRNISIHLDFCTRIPRRFFLVRGSKGELKWDILNGKIIFQSENSKNILFESEFNIKNILIDQIKSIVRIDNSNVLIKPCSLTEGIATLRLMKNIKAISKKYE